MNAAEVLEDDDGFLYEDIPDFDLFQPSDLQIQQKFQAFQQEIAHLKYQHESLLLKVETLEKEKKILSKNISSLFKTAQAEIQRKDRLIESLRHQHEDNNEDTKGVK